MKLSLIEKQYERVTSSNDNVYSNLRNKFFLIVSTAIIMSYYMSHLHILKQLF